MTLRPPFPWYGGKRRVAAEVWARFGDVRHYVEPFAGGLAVLLGRPDDHRPGGLETVNDLDRYVANFWRAVRADPEAVARHADGPVLEVDLRARHRWLVEHAQDLARLDDDPDAFDAKIAGWWVWGVCAWVGGGWCLGRTRGQGKAGREAHLDGGKGLGVRTPRLNDNGAGVHAPSVQGRGECAERLESLVAACQALADRLRGVRVCSGDWSRVVTDAVVGFPPEGPTGILLDPPYSVADRDPELYAQDSVTVAHVRARALELARHPRMRIALCGYEEEHGPHMPKDWSVYAWSAQGGAQRRDGGAKRARANRHRERIWFSPACLPADAGPMFAEAARG